MQDRFNSNILQSLYNLVHTIEVANLNNTNDVFNCLYIPIRSVLDNPAALQESRDWDAFQTVIKHHENNFHEYKLMPKDVSMCMSLFMNIYH
jgi:hypothetical protein